MDKTETQNEQPVAQNDAPASAPEEQKTEKPQETTDEVAPAATEAKKEEKPAEKPAEDEEIERVEEVKTDQPAQEKAKESAPEDTRPEYISKNPALAQFFKSLPAILKKTEHNEMWGVTLKDFEDIPTVNVLIKFLRANEGNIKEAEEQLTKSLEWRKKMDPLDIVENSKFSLTKFKNLGYVTTHNDEKEGTVVFTWNIYGAVKDINATFGNLDEFIKWRVALMELSIRELKLAEATTVIDYNGEDPYRMYQVHDYQNVSFLRMNPTIRNASRQTIEIFGMAYPELLREKFFINVPVLMGWVFTALKVFLSKNTIRKFHPITNGVNLAREFSSFGAQLPKVYGGNGPELAEFATTVALVDDTPEEKPKESEAKSTEPAAEKKDEDAKTEDAKAEDTKKEEVKSEEAKAEEPSKSTETEKTTEKGEKPAAEANGNGTAEAPVEAK